MKRIAGVEFTEDMPRLSNETAIERPSENVRILWRYFDAGFARSYHSSGGTVDLMNLGNIDGAEGIDSFTEAQ